MNSFLITGTYTSKLGHAPNANGKGVVVYKLQDDSSYVEVAVDSSLPHPSWVTAHPTKNVIYACHELEGVSKITSFNVDPKTGKLTLTSTQSSLGEAACHGEVDKTGKVLFIANYSSGCITSFIINDDGSLQPSADHLKFGGSGPNKSRQEGPHAHGTFIDYTTNTRMLVPNLGNDTVHVCQFDTQGKMKEISCLKLDAGSGPRHVVYHPTLDIVYVLSELLPTVTVCSWDHKGELKSITSASLVPEGFTGSTNASAIRFHAKSNTLYCSNRFYDTISSFDVDSKGNITPKSHTSTHGKTPRDMQFNPDGTLLYVANQDSDDIQVFSVAQDTGDLTHVPKSEIKMSGPTCLLFW